MRTAFFTTASAVTALSVCERGLGFLYRVVLARFLGAEGLGLYQVALSLFALFLTLGTGGIPVTVSRLISKSKAEARPLDERRALSAGLSLSLALTLPFVLSFTLFPSLASPLFSDERGIPVFRILMLGLCFSALYAVFRGSFWGNKRFLLSSILELAEESVMVIAGVLLLRNAPSAAQGARLAAWAVVLSYLFSFTLAVLCFWLGGGKLAKPKKTLKPLFASALPITTVRASSSLISSVVAVLLPVALMRAGASESDALTLFGVLSGMVIPVLFIPSTIIGSLALVLVPELSEDYYGNRRARLYQNLARGLTVSLLVACFLIPFFYAVGEELGVLAFSQPLAGEFIRKGSFILLPMSLTMISTSILNSIGCEKQTFAFYFIGEGVMLLCILLLPRVCGGYAYILGMGASFILTALCNLVLLGIKCKGLYGQMRKNKGVFGLFTAVKGLLCVLPLSLVGRLFYVLFARVCGAFLSLLFAALALLLVSALVWLALRIVPTPRLRKKRKTGKKEAFL